LNNSVAMRGVGYYNRLAGWIDAVHPEGQLKPDSFTTRANVNSGDREGVRLALDIAPTDNLTITPRFIYQKVAMEGWNRVDEFNILANPFTTTRPTVTLGDNKQFIQLDEPFTDKFQLGDLNIKYDFGGALLTSITSLTNRDILVVRDATALTGSVTGGSIGLPEDVYTLNAPLYDATRAKGWTQELRLSNNNSKDRLQWVVGGFYADTRRSYAQTLVVNGFTALSGIPSQSTYAPNDNLYWSDLHYKDRQYALFGEGTFAVTDRFSLTAGLRYYNYKVDKTLIFDGLFSPAEPLLLPGITKAHGFAPRFIASYKVSDSTTLNAQASKGFRLGGFNDPILQPLCSPDDLVTFGGFQRWKDETAWNYEIGSKSRLWGGRGSLNASAFYVDVRDLQVVVTAGTCSSRIVVNVPRSRSVGGELEFAYAPTDNIDFSISGGYNDSKVRSTINGTEAVVEDTGIREGNRLPSVPKFQMAAAATLNQPFSTATTGYATATYQHVGSRYTQLGDQEPGVGVIDLNHFGANTIGGPLTQSTFTFNPLLPAYDIVNLRLGVRHGGWDIALYCNNLTNEKAFLAIDRERGFFARMGFLTNQPRTIGITSRVDF
jgi:iron complex outermembrane recepter protein